MPQTIPPIVPRRTRGGGRPVVPGPYRRGRTFPERSCAPMTATRPRALLVEAVHPTAADILTLAGFDVEQVGFALDEQELVARLDGVQVLGLRSRTHVTEKVLDAGSSL